MPTLTGQKLSELSTLSLGGTGTKFYAVSTSDNSYKMYEKDLYRTLNLLHISGDYQPKNEDWRFVHKTGNESITGIKTFVNQLTVNNDLLGLSANFVGSIKTDQFTGNAIYNTRFSDSRKYSIDLYGHNLITYDPLNAVTGSSLDWDNRILKGLEWSVSGINASDYLSGKNYVFAPLITGNRIRTKKEFNHTTICYDGSFNGLIDLLVTGSYVMGSSSGVSAFHVLGATIRTVPNDATSPYVFNITDSSNNVIIANVTGKINAITHIDRWNFNSDNNTGRLFVLANRTFNLNIVSGADGTSFLAQPSLFGYYEYPDGYVA